MFSNFFWKFLLLNFIAKMISILIYLLEFNQGFWKMDFSIPLVFIGLFIVACLSLVFVYKYGMKEKSYEEAVAEQRQHTQALLGVKAKPKEKKPKKPSKKVWYIILWGKIFELFFFNIYWTFTCYFKILLKLSLTSSLSI